MKTIGYVSQANPFEDKKAWSGLIYKIREGIENAGYKVIWIPYNADTFKHKVLKGLIKLRFGKNVLKDHNKYYYKLSADTIDMKLVSKCDYLFFPGGAQMAIYRNFNKPIIYYTDANFSIMVNYYWHNEPKWIIKQGNETERLGIQNSYINIRASKWAADSVVNDYNGNPDRNYIIEFGANLEDKDIFHIKPYTDGTLNILFSGVDWKRKGAEIAIDAVRQLNERGITSKLLLVGLRDVPQRYANLPYVENIGFLNKNYPDQYQKYIDTIRQSHIFLLPTRAECAGIVFSEYSAYGLPIFTYNTGGIGNYVIDGINGYKLPLTAKGKEFADKIEESLKNNEFEKLGQGGIKLFNEKLNWHSWAESFKKIMQDNNL